MILIGDNRITLATIPDRSVQCCVTSPPYWGLRDYGTATWDGGDPSCDHQGKPMATKANINRNCGTGNDVKNAQAREFYKDICGKCGAKRIDSQIGLEQTPDEYVEQMVAVFRQVHRVLRDDGTLWLNLGDSYSAMRDSKARPDTLRGDGTGTAVGSAANRNPANLKAAGLKHKDLVGIPWRVAFALQADGWYLRQDIIWHKPNPMPESVTDRCTKAHEYIFLLSKSAKYYFDHEAIKEEAKTPPAVRDKHGEGYQADYAKGDRFSAGERTWGADGRKNKRSVWTVTTKPFRGAHFATFPPQLIEPCILAGSKPGDTILDPFFGAGTTGLVAQRHKRNWIGCELNPEYAEIARKRLETEQNLFTL
jgi:DNA modification methylase